MQISLRPCLRIDSYYDCISHTTAATDGGNNLTIVSNITQSREYEFVFARLSRIHAYK